MIHKFIIGGLRSTREATKFFCKAGARIVSAGIQNDQIVVWVEFDTKAEGSTEFSVEVFGTGWEIPYNAYRFIATVQDRHGFVWHIYES